ncbi:MULTISPECIES: mycofactocin oligosaccharide methyltransferase MftM [unclassified Dietzia]|uniref:mycofactocin oligosaccharide methyltransferase MftM n=1 Tax=unclassified Dietzia TaxID=2617939 RepID=UPI0015F7A05E|nr:MULTISPECIES: mycofactocin oligosaccharide methyltransferase MftM [unclassified Dietzia]MBB1023922.1 class I SAM-dependent methyltransferase [Dietzia sp. DQ12-76]MBB1026274.1 class I SAM-dependent methyltransferase [Dietzia sp. DQ11-38-2]
MQTTATPPGFREISAVRGGRGRRFGAFTVTADDRRVRIGHDLDDDEVSEALIPAMSRDLLATGVLHTVDEFHRAVTALVTCRDATWEECWSAYYRSSISALASGVCPFSPVHDRAVAEMVGHSAVEIGCCFGFLSLRLAREGVRTVAVDLDPAVLGLLRSCAPADGPLPSPVCLDARTSPLAAGTADTVYLVHVLEHVDEGAGWDMVRDALRLARRRVVIAVPFEPVAVTQYGHVRTFDIPTLAALADRIGSLCHSWSPGVRTRVDEDHGGWLVVDR